MTEPRLMYLEIGLTIALVVALLAAGVVAIANRKWPYRSVGQLTQFTVFALVVGFFVLTVGWMLWLMSAPCAEHSVCDAGAMAAAGAVMFGVIELLAAVLVGAPVAYFVLRLLRST